MSNRIYVGNLSFDTTTEAIRETFAALGTVEDVFVATDRDTGRSRGFAFVTMGSNEEAANAIERLNGKLVDGRPLRVNEAQERVERGSGGAGRSSGNGRGQGERSSR
jgi:RNA recognition motif-containing protein